MLTTPIHDPTQYVPTTCRRCGQNTAGTVYCPRCGQQFAHWLGSTTYHLDTLERTNYAPKRRISERWLKENALV